MARILCLVVSVTALYALVLGSLLGTIAGAGATARDGLVCQQQGDDPQQGGDHDPGCCAAACVSPVFVPRDAVAPSPAWPARPAIGLAWQFKTQPPSRAPPRTLASPRGPPDF